MNRKITMYSAGVRGKPYNTSYPERIEVTCVEDFMKAVQFDHVCACYVDGVNNKGKMVKAHRSIATFISSDCIPMDCDNDHTDNDSEWLKPEDVKEALPGVAFYAYPSRNHMKEKNGRAARPKYHYVFADSYTEDANQVVETKKRVLQVIPQFDASATDAARFFFGVEDPEVLYFDGDRKITEFLDEQGIILEDANTLAGMIPAGMRNSTLSRCAGKALKRFGLEDGKARQLFDNEAEKCDPPLDGKEKESIWNSALSFFKKKVASDPNYIDPDMYDEMDFSLRPNHYTEVDEAYVLEDVFGSVLSHSPEKGYMAYSGKVWKENEALAHGFLHRLTEMQLEELKPEIILAEENVNKAVEQVDKAKEHGSKAEIERAMEAKEVAANAAKTITAYRTFLLSCRNSKKIRGILKEAETPLTVSAALWDSKYDYINTPEGEVSLVDGNIEPHNPGNFHTKITLVAASEDGMDVWRDFLCTITCGDEELENYLQLIAGECMVGKVFCENLIIAHGSGRNGKSTFFNTLSRVMGAYSGQISAETLTTGRKNSKNWELAELHGKRMIVAPELEEGTRLDSAFVKKICSTDQILGEKKYKTPFVFEPSHTTVLYTNHLPRIGSNDAGTWRRIIVIPFNAVIEGKNDKKNYTEYLVSQAGGAVLSWMIKGAMKYIAAEYHIEAPKCVKHAIDQYKIENDWLSNFISEKCEVDASNMIKSSELYYLYREHCGQTGDFIRSAADFKAALEVAGYQSKRKAKGVYINGLKSVETSMLW